MTASRFKFITVETAGAVTVVTLDRPQVLNALHPPAHVELHEAFDAFAADPAQRVAVITGAGARAFCAGHDLTHQAATGGRAQIPPSGFAGLTSRFNLAKPVIAAVNGLALGGGFEIALACDLILADETAMFALPEPSVGMVALAGGLHRLPRAVGTTRALDLILSGRQASAAEGLQLGFVSRVIAPARLMDETLCLARRIAALSPAAVRASKQAVYRGLDEPSLEVAIRAQFNYPAVLAQQAGGDRVEGPAAFAQRRAPVWEA